ncbi:MAG: RnfABCDGE type electron transport complex subunit D [Chromatiales bacterium]|nr:RnfABCDGE type electron transport complex subunit D [Chromatiales bacterium]
MTGATALGYVKTELSRGIPVFQSLSEHGHDSSLVYTPDLMDLATGYKPGSLGETSAILILLGGLFLIRRGVITWHIPAAVLGTGVRHAAPLFNLLDPGRFAPGLFHLLSGRPDARRLLHRHRLRDLARSPTAAS